MTDSAVFHDTSDDSFRDAAGAITDFPTSGGAGIPETLIDAKGDLIVGAAADDADRLAVGVTNGHVLTVDSAQTLGVKWAAPTSSGVATDPIWDTKGDLAAATGADAAVKVAVGANDTVLVADSTQSAGIKWAAVPGLSAYVPVSTIDAKGDLLVGSANDAIDNLAVGTNGYVLTADSGETLGVKWAPAGSSGALTLICQSILSGSQASFDTNTILGGNIPGTYSHLQLIVYLRADDAVTSIQPLMRFNNDSGSNYDWVGPVATAAGAISSEGNAAATSIPLARVAAGSATADRFGVVTVDIPMYAATTGDKACAYVAHTTRGTATSDVIWESKGGTWRSTAAITRIAITDGSGGNFVAGSSFSLYGIS